MTAPPFLSDFDFNTPVKVNQNVTITLSAKWPTPGWSHVDTSITTDEQNKIMTISYLGKSSGGLTMQVIKPFTDEITVSFPTSGKWTIHFKGKNDDLQKEVEVRT